MYLLLESSVGTIAESKPWHAADTTENSPHSKQLQETVH